MRIVYAYVLIVIVHLDSIPHVFKVIRAHIRHDFYRLGLYLIDLAHCDVPKLQALLIDPTWA
jgi:hypothetical protein